MKLPSALALAARPMDVPTAQLRVLLRTLARQQAEATDAKPPSPLAQSVSADRVDGVAPASPLGFSLLASQQAAHAHDQLAEVARPAASHAPSVTQL